MAHTALMRTYASPGLCFDCSHELRGEWHCPRCGLPVVGPEASRLAQLLAEADGLMVRLDAVRHRTPLPTAQGPARPARSPRVPVGTSPDPSESASAAVPRPRRSVSAGSVLLALGACCLVVGALVFVAVTWGSLSLSTRTLILLAMTGLAFAVTAVLTSRRLHGSVEALSTVAWTFLAIDLAAGRTSGLVGLDRLSDEGFVVVAGLLAALPASGVVVLTRHVVGREPIVSSLVAFVGWALVALGVVSAWTASAEWLLVVLVVFTAALSAGYALLGLSWLMWAVAGSTVAVHAALVLAVALTCLRNDHRSLIAQGRVWPVLACLTLSVVAVAVLRRHARTHADTVVVVGSVLVSALVAVLVAAPAWHSGAGWGAAALCLATLGCTALASTPPGQRAQPSWANGPRSVAFVAAGGCVLVALPWVAAVAVALVESMTDPWNGPVGTRIDVFDIGDDLPLWTAAACLLAVAASAAAMSTWKRWTLSRPVTLAAAAVLGWMAASLVVVVLSSLLLVAVLVVAAGAVVTVLAGSRRGNELVVLGGGGVLAVSCALAMGSVGLSLGVWSGSLALCAAMALLRPRARTSAGAAFAGVLLAVGCTAAVVELFAGTAIAQSLALAIVVALTLLATMALSASLLRAAVMLGVVCTAVLPVAIGADLGPGRAGITLTIIGASAALVGVLQRNRRPVGAVGAALLLAAWWLRLVATDIDVVEAYTGLPAAVLLAAGLWAVVRHRRSTLEALLPGLVLAVAPSLPWAVLEPTSTRGLLLSAVGLGLLAAGTTLRWAAPFLLGAGVVGLMAFAQLVVYAQVAPRWAVLTAVGLVLLGVGITWEARVRDLRSTVVFVTAMH